MMTDAVEPPMRDQKTRRLDPGEDCPDCAHCGQPLHEARPALSDVLDAVSYCDTTKTLYGKLVVDCPTCSRPNEVAWHVDTADHTWDACARTMWTKADYKYSRFWSPGPRSIDADDGEK